MQSGTTLEQNLANHFTDIGLVYDPMGGLSQDVADAFFSGRCDVLTGDAAALASRIALRDDADDHIILPQIISKEPLAPGVRDYDSEWKDVVNWVVHGLIAAEEMGITQANVSSLAANRPTTPSHASSGFPTRVARSTPSVSTASTPSSSNARSRPWGTTGKSTSVPSATISPASAR